MRNTEPSMHPASPPTPPPGQMLLMEPCGAAAGLQPGKVGVWGLGILLACGRRVAGEEFPSGSPGTLSALQGGWGRWRGRGFLRLGNTRTNARCSWRVSRDRMSWRTHGCTATRVHGFSGWLTLGLLPNSAHKHAPLSSALGQLTQGVRQSPGERHLGPTFRSTNKKDHERPG